MGDTPSKILAPLEAEDDQFLQPLFVGFGRSAAAVEPSLSGSPVEVPLMEVVSAGDVELEGNHVKAFVSEGRHNTYPNSGAFPSPIDPTRVSICDWAGSLPGAPGADAGEPPPAGPTSKQTDIVTLMKLLTMGLFAGLIAAWIELGGVAAGQAASDDDDAPAPAPPDLGGDDVAQLDPEGLILAPADLVDTFSEDAAFVRSWAGTPDRRVFDERWETLDLSWGPPAVQDPFRRRQGRPMPRYIGPFISALGAHLEEG
jgi:hypothetical protein